MIVLAAGNYSPVVRDMLSSVALNAGVGVAFFSTPADYRDVVPNPEQQTLIDGAALIIADITGADPSVMYDLGYAIGLQKPVLLIAADYRTVPLNLLGHRVAVYGDDVGHFMESLSEIVPHAMSHPEAFRITYSAEEATRRHSVFISYSHVDLTFLDRLLVHLKPLERDGLIDLWVDTRLRAGDQWRSEISAALERANVAVLLISADFLASDFVVDDELPPLLRDAESKGTRIIPVIVRPCRFARDQHLSRFQAVNDPTRPLSSMQECERESVFDQVAAEVELTLGRG